MANTKMSFEFTPEDMRILRKLKREEEASFGKCSYVAIIRAAIRQLKRKER